MKFVKELVNGEAEKLRNILKNCPSFKARMRANAILLSSKSFSITAIAAVFNVHKETVSCWLNNWESKGMMSLFDEAKPGRPKKSCKENCDLKVAENCDVNVTEITNMQVAKILNNVDSAVIQNS